MKKKGCLIDIIALIAIVLIFTCVNGSHNELNTTPQVIEETPQQLHEQWVDNQFASDGRHIELVKLVKEYLNDPDSFEHVNTVYTPNGDDLTIFMEYRTKNGYNALILQNVTAKACYSTNTIEIISEND